MTRIEFWSAVMGLLVATVVMFNHMNGRFDRLQAETNARFDAQQAETNGRFDAVNARLDAQQDSINTRFDAQQDSINARLDTMQAENSRRHDDLNRRFDELFEVIRAFEGRISRLEGRLDVQPSSEDAE